MIRDEITRMAREAGIEFQANRGITGRANISTLGSQSIERIEQLVKKAVSAEREACANVAKAISDKYAFGYYGQEVDTADEIESAIRARGNP